MCGWQCMDQEVLTGKGPSGAVLGIGFLLWMNLHSSTTCCCSCPSRLAVDDAGPACAAFIIICQCQLAPPLCRHKRTPVGVCPHHPALVCFGAVQQ